MPDQDLIIRNANVVRPDDTVRADIGVADGRVIYVGQHAPGSCREEIDASGLYAFPGGLDIHVHFDEPGRTEWEGLASGSAALAAGGMTTFFDMPLNSSPVTIDAETFDAKHEAARASSLIDFGLWGGLVPGNLDSLEELFNRGAVGFKAFMCYSGIDEFPPVDDLTLMEGMRRCHELGSILAVHAENEQITRRLAQRARAAGRVGPRDFLESRPVIAELEAISRAIMLAAETGCPLHIVHVSCARGVLLVAQARAEGIDVSCETCPHYLVLTEDDVEQLGAYAKSAPPLRGAGDRDGLWSLIADGRLTIVASDHSPGPPDLKQGDDFFAVWGGFSGCQSTLQLLLAYGHQSRGLPLAKIASLISREPASRFNISHKGAVAVGLDADVILVDLAYAGTVAVDDLLYRHKQSGFVGARINGRIRRTIVRGVTVLKDGEIVSPPIGSLVRPAGRRR